MIKNEDIIVSMQTDSPKYVYGCYKIRPTGIVVHSTGANNPNLSRYVDAPAEVGVNRYDNYFGGENSNDVVPHGSIGLDINGKVRVAQILPYDLACQCAGKGSKGSYNVYTASDGVLSGYIQFEMCEDNLNDYGYFMNVMDVASDYCAYLMSQYDIKIEDVVSHKEAHARGMASGHGDPENWLNPFGKDMDWFRNKVLEHLKEYKPPEKPEEPDNQVIYRVQVGAFVNKQNAVNLCEQLKSLGYQAFVVECNV